MRTEGLLTKLCILLCTFLLGATSAWAEEVIISNYLTLPANVTDGQAVEVPSGCTSDKLYWRESPDGTFGARFYLGDDLTNARTTYGWANNVIPYFFIDKTCFQNVSPESGFTIAVEAYVKSDGTNVYGRMIDASVYTTTTATPQRQHFFAWTTGKNGNMMSEFHRYTYGLNENENAKKSKNFSEVQFWQTYYNFYDKNGSTLLGAEGIIKNQTTAQDFRNGWHSYMLRVDKDGNVACYVDGIVVYHYHVSFDYKEITSDDNEGNPLIATLKNIKDYAVAVGTNPSKSEGINGWMRNFQIVATGNMGTVSLLRSQSAFNKTLLANSMDLTTAARLIPQGSTVTLAGGKGYMVNWDNIMVKDAENNQVTLSGTGSTRTFTMPAGVVTVSIVDAQGHEVEIASEDDAEQYIPHKPEATISFAQTSVNKKYGDAAFSSPALSHKQTTNGTPAVEDGKQGTVTYESSNTSVATVDAESGQVTITGVGSAEIFAKVEDSDDYTYPVEKISYQLTVDKGVAELSIADLTVNGGTSSGSPTVQHKLGETLLSGTGIGTVAYTKTTDEDNIISSVNASTGVITFNTANTGSATITATVTDGTLYTYSNKTVTFTVNVIGSGIPHNVQLNATTYNNKLTANGTALTNSAIEIKQGTKVQLAAAKAYRVTDWSKITVATANSDAVAVDENHRFTMPDANVTITIVDGAFADKTEGTIAFTTVTNNKVNETYVGTQKTITHSVANKKKSDNTVISSGAGTVTYTSGNTTVATVDASTGQVTIKGLGITVITATVADNDTYYYNTTSVSYTLEVGKGTATVSAPPTAKSGLTYNKSAQELINAGTAGTDNAMRYKLGSGAWETTIPKATNAGTYTVFYKSVGSGTNAQYYNESVESSLQVTIAKADGTVSALAITGWTYGEEAKDFTATTTNDVQAYRAEYKQKTAGDNTYTLDVPTNAGQYTLKVTFNSTDNYKAVSRTADFEIAKRAATVTAKDQTIDFGGTIKSAVAEGTTIADLVTFSGLADGDEISAVTLNTTQTAAGTYDNSTAGKTGITINSGSVTIVKSSGSADMTNNYTLTLNNGKLTINKVVAVVNTAPTANTGLTYTGAAQQLVSAGATDHGTMVYSTTANGDYTTAIPTGTDAKYSATVSENYTVYYKVQPDANHTASEAVAINNIQIAAKNISTSDEVVGNFTNMPTAGMEYTGSAIEPEGEVKSTANPVATLVRNQDFDIAFTYNTDPANSGDANAPTVTITGKGNYTGTKTLKFTIWAHYLNEYGASATGWHTLYTSDGPFDVSGLSSKIEVYTISAVDASTAKATLTPQTQILRNVPMIIKVNEDMTSTPLPKVADNSQSGTTFSGFKGATSDQAVSNGSEYHYVLAGDKFMEMHGTTVGAYRCYLQMARLSIYNTAAARQHGFSLSFGNNGNGDDTTGIDTLTDDSQDDDHWYNLRGVRIPKPTRPGVYVHKGRVVTVKK